jgi:carboxypeptidase Q
VKRAFLACTLVAACASKAPAPPDDPPPRPLPAGRAPAALPAARPAAAPARTATPIADAYRATAVKIIAAARADRGAFDKLRHLTDHIGARLSGSPQLDQAIAWAAKAMAADGLDVHTEKVMVPHWVRGAESAAIVAPVRRDLVAIGLGGTVATPRRGITAPVIVVSGWDDLKARAADVKGKIVLYDVAMAPYDPVANSAHYGDVVPYRWGGATQAAKLGAAAVLIRSITAHSLRSPHTGALDYGEGGGPKIPALAVTVEDAELLHRLADEGEVKVHLVTSGKMLPDVPSANVIGELKGKDRPDEVVVIGGHIDSWDVGAGAHDDGAGIVTAMHALATIHKLGLTPRRTIRVVLFTNEENGLRGGKGYFAAHQREMPNHVAALESDRGAFPPRGFNLTASDAKRAASLARLQDLASLLGEVGATLVSAGESEADVHPMNAADVVTVGLDVRGSTYFDVHHTQADTLDKIDPAVLADDVAAVAVWAYVVADMPDRLDAP